MPEPTMAEQVMLGILMACGAVGLLGAVAAAWLRQWGDVLLGVAVFVVAMAMTVGFVLVTVGVEAGAS